MRYFVSGHRDLTKEEFEEHYVPLIQKVVKEDLQAVFLVGDWEGCDSMFLDFVKHNKYNNYIFVCYVGKPSRVFRIENYTGIILSTWKECDEYMTEYSDFDITWIRPGKEDSHTAKNIKRRYNLC